MNRNAHMIGSLSRLLEGEEKLLTPIYGTLVQKKRRWFGYFGLTEHHLLIALLGENGQAIQWSSRVPLEIKKATVKKGLLPLQYHIRMEFCEGEAGHFLASKKVLGLENQGKNLKGFLEFLQARSG